MEARGDRRPQAAAADPRRDQRHQHLARDLRVARRARPRAHDGAPRRRPRAPRTGGLKPLAARLCAGLGALFWQNRCSAVRVDSCRAKSWRTKCRSMTRGSAPRTRSLMATSTKTSESRSSSTGKGGHRLSAAFEAVNTLPALNETVARLIKLTDKPGASVGELAELIESDTAVAIAVMRSANNGGGPRGRVSNVPDAIESLSPAGVRKVADKLDTYDLFQSVGNWERLPERFRRHAVATRHAAERIAGLARRRRSRRAGHGRAAPRHRPARAHPPLPRLRGDPQRPLALARGPHPARASRARHRPHPGRRRARPALGPALGDRQRDRAPPLAGGHRPGRRRPARRHGRPPLAGRPRLRRGDGLDGQGLQAARRAPQPDRLRVSALLDRRASAATSPARSRSARSTPCAASPRARSTRRSPQRWASRRAPCAPTCTTSTARSAPPIVPRRCSSPANAAGSDLDARDRRAPASSSPRVLAPASVPASLIAWSRTPRSGWDCGAELRVTRSVSRASRWRPRGRGRGLRCGRGSPWRGCGSSRR